MHEDAVRLLTEVSNAHTMEEVRAVVGRWRYKWCVSKDPDLPAKIAQTRREGGTPITLEELRVKFGL